MFKIFTGNLTKLLSLNRPKLEEGSTGNLVRLGLIRALKKWARSTSNESGETCTTLQLTGLGGFPAFEGRRDQFERKRKKLKQRQNRVGMKKGRTELVGLKKVTERLESRPTLHDLRRKSKKAKFYVNDHPFVPTRPA